MTTTPNDNRRAPRAPGTFPGAAAAVVALVAIIGRLPALGAWWNQDDWGLLGRVRGLVPGPEVPVRWLAQDLYWQAMVPLAGLAPDPYAATRILLHALAAAGVVRLAARCRLGPAQQWLAGLIMAATPLAFSPLYWAAGIQDLMAVAAGVWALERWLAGGRGATLAAVILAVAAVAAKETVAGLPLLMAWLSWRGPQADPPAVRTRLPWLLIPLAASAASVALALGHFATDQHGPYALGDPGLAARNLVTYGWWLLLPGPEFPPQPAGWQRLLGGGLWLAWIVWAAWQWRGGRRDPAFALLGAGVMLLPLLGLARHVAPDLAYPVEPFGALALAGLVPRRWRPRGPVLAILAVLACAWALVGMRGRLDLRGEEGLPADPLVRRTAASWAACQQLRQLPLPDSGLVLLQPPLTPQTARMAAALGEDRVTGSLLYHSLDGVNGVRVLLGRDVPVHWTSGLLFVPETAFVALDGGGRLIPWGPVPQALLYQTLTDVAAGLFPRARRHLLRASLLVGPGGTFSFAYDPDLLPLGLARVLANADAFLAHLDQTAAADAPTAAALEINFQRLVAACTGDGAQPGASP